MHRVSLSKLRHFFLPKLRCSPKKKQKKTGLSRNLNGFSVQIEVFSKKKTKKKNKKKGLSRNLNGFSVQIEVFSKKKKKKKTGLSRNLNGFSVQIEVFSKKKKKKKKKKGLHRNWDAILPMECPNIQTICPNK